MEDTYGMKVNNMIDNKESFLSRLQMKILQSQKDFTDLGDLHIYMCTVVVRGSSSSPVRMLAAHGSFLVRLGRIGAPPGLRNQLRMQLCH